VKFVMSIVFSMVDRYTCALRYLHLFKMVSVKMLIKYKILIISLLACMALNVYSDPWSGTSEIMWVYPTTDGLAFITSYKNEGISSCDNGARYMISSKHPNYNVLSSALLAAFFSDKKISFNIDSGQEKTCSPTINRFNVYK